MPVTTGSQSEQITQREQYALGGIGRKYWDRRDDVALTHVIGPRILDAGCGEGITLEKIVARFPEAEVVGVDVDGRNIRICGRHQLPVRQASVYELPFEPGSFDSCVLMEVIEHLDQPDRALEELARVTRPGGRLVALYPVDWTMWTARVLCGKWREAKFDPGHVRQWSAHGLKAAMRRCGWRPIASRGLPFPGPLRLHGLVVGERLPS